MIFLLDIVLVRLAALASAAGATALTFFGVDGLARALGWF